jgi:hypothetical protein
MNLLRLFNRAPNHGLGNDDVFKNIPLSVCPWVGGYKQFFVTILDDVRLLSVGSSTTTRTVFRTFVVSNKFSPALNANMRLGCGERSRLLWGRVCKFYVVGAAIAFAEMRLFAVGNNARQFGSGWLSLFGKFSTLLPLPIARRPAKRLLCPWADALKYRLGALRA